MTADFVPVRPTANPSSFQTCTAELWSPAECERLLASMPDGDWVPVDQHRDGAPFRSVALQRPDFSDHPDLYDRLLGVFDAANSAMFHFDLAGLAEFDPPHAVAYEPGHGHYGWHMDVGEHHPLRKLSLVVLLDDPASFDGGELEIKGWGVQALGRGRALLFPSYFWHQVRPVTAGRRTVLVAWCQGPSFR